MVQSNFDKRRVLLSRSIVGDTSRESRFEANLASHNKVCNFGGTGAWENETAPRSFLPYYGPADAPWDYIYRQMEERDPALAGLNNRVIDGILSIPFKIVSANEDATSLEARDMCVEKIRGIKDFKKAIRHSLSSVPDGASFVEIEWDGTGGVFSPLRLQYRPKRRFAFVDINGYDVLHVRRPGKLEVVPYGAVIYSHFGRTDNPWGWGLKDIAYWYWLARLYTVLDLMHYVEQVSKPVTEITWDVDEVDTEKEDAPEHPKVQAAAIGEHLATGGGGGWFSHSDDINVTTRKVPHDTQNFQTALDILTRAIANLFIGESQTAMPKSMGSYGSYDVLDRITARGSFGGAVDLAGTLESQLIRPLVDLNVPGAAYPRVMPNHKSPEMMTHLLAATRDALNAGFPISKKELEERWLIGEAEPGDTLFKLAEGVTLGGSTRARRESDA